MSRFDPWLQRCERARSIPILEVVDRLGIGEPRKSGKHYLIRCPFHNDRRPSFYIEPVKAVWKCFPCDDGGDGIGLWMRVRGVGFSDAVRELTA